MGKVLFFLILVLVAGIATYSLKYGFESLTINSTQNIKSLNIRNITIAVEIADTPVSRKQGLSGRNALGYNQGMLFVYGEPGNYSFWMKDMKFPIDIIWIGKDKRIVDITKNISPETFPETFKSAIPAQYVLELNAGWADNNFIRVDDLVSF